MADTQRTIDIIFNGVDAVSDILTNISGGMEDFGGKVSKIGEPFVDLLKYLAAVDVAIAGLAAAALMARSNIESETTKMANAINLPAEKAKEFSEVARSVYKDNFVETITEAFAAVTETSRRFKDSSTEDIQKITEASLLLSKNFGADYSETLGAVQTLMKDFGLSSQQSFDFITAGFQKGLNGSGDFIESITEYSTQFSNAGADAGQFFSVLQSGMQNGVLGTDKAADMFKEFRVRIQDGSKSTKEALESIGIDPAAFEKNMASGKMTATDAFNLVQQKLNETTDKNTQFNAGVALLGTQFEDMGTKAALAVSTAITKIDELAGSLDSVKPDESLGAKLEQTMRTIKDVVTNAKFWDGLDQALGADLDKIRESFERAFKIVDFSDLEKAFNDVVKVISDAFKDMDLDLTTTEGMRNAIELVKDSIASMLNVTAGAATPFMALVGFLKEATDWFNTLSQATQEMIGKFAGFAAGLTTLGAIIGAGGVLVGGIGNIVALFSSGGALATGISFIVALLTGPFGLAIALGTVGTAVAAFTLSSMESEHKKAIAAMEATGKKLDEFYLKVKSVGDSETRIEIMALIEKRDFDAAQKAIDAWIAEDKKTQIAIEADNKAFEEYWDKLEKIPEEKMTRLIAYMNAGQMEAVEALLDNIPDEKQVDVFAKADSKSLSKTTTELQKVGERADGTPIYAEITAKTKDVDKAKKEIESLPTEKLLEIKLQGEIDTEIARIKAEAELTGSYFEWTAKVNIAEIEAGAEVAKQAFESIGESVSALSDSTSNMFSSLTDNWKYLDIGAQMDFQDILERQQNAQNEALKSQIKLNDAQTEYLRKKADAISSGRGLIQVDMTGAEPEIQAVMWKIVKNMQMQASKEASELLLGV